MKKKKYLLNRYRVIAIIIMMLFVTACSKESNNPAASFPPADGTSWTYKVGTSTYTIVAEEVVEKVGGYAVYRRRIMGDPPGLGLYLGYDPIHGEVEVATDTWNVINPNDNEKYFWNPPRYS